MPTSKLSASRRDIIETYKIVRQAPSEHTIVFRIAKILGYKIDKNKNNSFVRKVINEYIEQVSNQ